MPVWHKATREYVAEGKLALLGLIQEQHADRCQLFAQWHRFEFPILHDPLNLREIRAVPIVTAIDEHGLVQPTPKPDRIGPEFVDKIFPAPAGVSAVIPIRFPKLDQLKAAAEARPSAESWRAYADGQVMVGQLEQIDRAIDAYRRAADHNPSDARISFRLGVALRMRYDSPRRQPDDFQRAIDAWTAAVQLDPNHYIYRRRVQQYGPRLDKPYSFYDWVTQAREAITKRGETPVPLIAEPIGAELAYPIKKFATSSRAKKELDPNGEITRDRDNLIQIETAVVPRPARTSRNASVSVHLVFRPSSEKKAHWNNEVDPLMVWIRPPENWSAVSTYLELPNPETAVSHEVRAVHFELKPPTEMAPGKYLVPGYALYYVCEDVDGKCLFRRQDIAVEVEITE